MIIRSILLYGLLLFGLSLSAQSKNALKEEAKTYIASAHYADAVRTIERSRSLVKSDKEAQFLLAVCHFQLNNLRQAETILQALLSSEKSPYPECWLYLGKVYHAQQRFAEAAEQYKLYLRSLRAEHLNRQMVIEEIRRCDNGLRLIYADAPAVVENLGPKVNTAEDEFGPILSPNLNSRLYFSAIKSSNSGGLRDKYTEIDDKFGHPLSDMFSTQLEGGQWQASEPMHYLLNSPQHEYLIGFSGQGKVLLYFQGWTWDQGVIFADTFQQTEQRSLTTTPFLGESKGSVGEQHLFLYNDTLLIFASRRAGGYGGLDLYKSVYRSGRWSSAQNLGPTINSAFDETTPFLARDGVNLFYSTNNSRISTGGLDIVRTVYLPDAQRWSTPKNMGLPINSPADDTHFRLARDGFTGFLASARKDGLGQRDIYVAYFTKYRQEMEPPVVAVSFVPPTQQTVAPTTVVTTPSSPRNTPNRNTSPSPTSNNSQQWMATANSLPTLSMSTWLSNMVGTARSYPQDHILLSCYVPTNGPTLRSARLFDAISQLRNFSSQLIRQGIASERIFLRAQAYSGSSFQLRASLVPQSPNETRAGMPVLGESSFSSLLPTTDAALCYKVQVVSVQKSYANEDLSQQADLMLENAAHLPYLRYTVGAAGNFAQAERIRRQVVAAGYSGAYVVPFLYGERLDKNRVQQFVGQFPDLQRFLDR